MFHDIVSSISSLSLKDHKNFRLQLLQAIKTTGFNTYVTELKNLQKSINNFDPNKYLDDEYWNPDKSKKSWWEQKKEYKWILQKYNKSKVISATSVIANQVLTSSAVDMILNKIEWATPPQQIFMKTLINNYFNRSKRLWPVTLNIEMSYLNSNEKNNSYLDMTDIKNKSLTVLMHALSGSGPFMLKILQQISNNTSDDLKEWSQLTKKIFDAVPPLTPDEFTYIKDNLAVSVDKKNISSDLLGSASISETHETKDQFGEWTVLKLLRPMYIIYFLCECDFILVEIWKLLGTTIRRNKSYTTEYQNTLIQQSRQLLLFLTKEYINEFDFERESLHTIIGYHVYNKPSLQIYSAQLIQCALNPFPVILQTKVGTVTMKNLLSYCKSPQFLVDNPGGKKLLSDIVAPRLFRTILKLFDLWIENVFWGKEGFFHADLHLGNIMTRSFSEILQLKSDYSPIYIIDYGSSSIISTSKKCQLLTALLQSAKFHQMYISFLDTTEHSTTIDTDITREILPFFKTYQSLSLSKQNQLRRAINKEDVRKKHRENLKNSKIFIEYILKTCDVSSPPQEYIDKVSRFILNYDEKLEFGKLFLEIVRFGGDIGNCLSNEIITFARGLAYLEDTNQTLFKLCASNSVKPYLIDTIIERNLIKHPTQLYNFLTGKIIC